MKVDLAQNRIFGDQPGMREVEDVGRNQPVRRSQPALAISFGIVGHDQVEVEHSPVELGLAQA